jgi:glycosyltransferase 2 family protein
VTPFLTRSGRPLARHTDVLLAVAALAALIVVLALVPRTRRLLLRTVVPRVKGLVPKLLQALSQPARLAVSAGSSLLLNVGYITAFMASLSAVGAHPPILEAALVAGLAGIGIPAAHAIAAVVVFRFATFWLPIPIGWLSYQGLQRSGTL